MADYVGTFPLMPASDGTAAGTTGASLVYVMQAYYSTESRDHIWKSVDLEDLTGANSGLGDPENLSRYRVLSIFGA